MVGCRRCTQFGFVHLPLSSKRFQRWLYRNRITTATFHEALRDFVYPRTKIRICPCCGNRFGEYYYEPGIHYITGQCRFGRTASQAEEVLMRYEIHPLYWEYAMTDDPKFHLAITTESRNSYYGPGGNAWDAATRELALLKQGIAQ